MGAGGGAGGSSTHLTLLFTDIEASTRAWEDRPTAPRLPVIWAL
jgi:class 3 adenylate cyclase